MSFNMEGHRFGYSLLLLMLANYYGTGIIAIPPSFISTFTSRLAELSVDPRPSQPLASLDDALKHGQIEKIFFERSQSHLRKDGALPLNGKRAIYCTCDGATVEQSFYLKRNPDRSGVRLSRCLAYINLVNTTLMKCKAVDSDLHEMCISNLKESIVHESANPKAQEMLIQVAAGTVFEVVGVKPEPMKLSIVRQMVLWHRFGISASPSTPETSAAWIQPLRGGAGAGLQAAEGHKTYEEDSHEDAKEILKEKRRAEECYEPSKRCRGAPTSIACCKTIKPITLAMPRHMGLAMDGDEQVPDECSKKGSKIEQVSDMYKVEQYYRLPVAADREGRCAEAEGSLLHKDEFRFAPNMLEAVRLRDYRLAAEQGHAEAQFRLGEYHQKGQGGLAVDMVEAVRYYRLAAEQGHAEAQYRLGNTCQKGEGGLPANLFSAIRCFRLAAEQGHAEAQFRLGECHQKGQGGLATDVVEAVRYYRLAAEQGHAEAQYQFGKCHEKGEGGLVSNMDEALRCFRLAAEHGHAEAQCRLGKCCQEGQGLLLADMADPMRYYWLAAEQGHAEAQCRLGECHEKGQGGLISANIVEAVRYYRLAAEQGHAEAQHRLGRCYEKGQGGLAVDMVEAVRYYRLAAEQGHAEAQYRLGNSCQKGEGGLPANLFSAIRCFRLAAEQGHAEAQFRLGECHQKGQGGLATDVVEAVRYPIG